MFMCIYDLTAAAQFWIIIFNWLSMMSFQITYWEEDDKNCEVIVTVDVKVAKFRGLTWNSATASFFHRKILLRTGICLSQCACFFKYVPTSFRFELDFWLHVNTW